MSNYGSSNSNFKHGEKGTKLYRVWEAMRKRCNNPKDKRYSSYGERGIAVCEDWNTYVLFRNWAKESGYREGLTIDRIDNNGPYSPKNCRWATRKEQANNQQNTVFITYLGVKKSLHEWADFLGIVPSTLYARYVLSGWSAERSLFETVSLNKYHRSALKETEHE